MEDMLLGLLVDFKLGMVDNFEWFVGYLFLTFQARNSRPSQLDDWLLKHDQTNGLFLHHLYIVDSNFH